MTSTGRSAAVPRAPHLYLFDALLAVAATAAYVSFSYAPSTPAQPGFTGPVWLGWLVAAAVGVPLAVRRRWPLPVFAVVLSGTVAASLLHMVLEPHLALGCAAYLVGLAERWWRAVVTLAVALAAAATALAVSEPLPGDTVGTTAAVWLVIGTAWVLGRGMRQGRLARAAEAERAAARALTDQRLRIARELHDVVAHSMSLIAVKAGVANHVAEQNPAEAVRALRTIETTSRAALVEMRHVLGVLRSAEEPGMELAPVPGLAGLRELAEHAEQAGVRVTLQAPERADLPDGVALSAYRIVQEALTNVVKHAAPAECVVRVEALPGELRIEVTSGPPGTARPRAPEGHGLIGMRERVAVYSGRFDAGPRPDGGFRVTASLPYEP
ncbi:sensor histidine kinase [Amycolatopsis suaedae]|uniref:histidine kinase n=1 Tax=Amycolatopsis suaedae TaxID=2510978 RepID=A0A4Q7JEM0_9PSEU|nr:sensor histidine kinase [Amycolatopsis suaedae]RZQ65758.1 sensor histidine kinase [Amycolatopsis suaedae]